jgi:diacylglycerol kinase family enzyme
VSERALGSVDVIVNRVAHHLEREGPILRALRAGASGGARIHETRSLRDLDAAVAAIRERGTGCVILAGGDGSYLAGVSALARAFSPPSTTSDAARPSGGGAGAGGSDAIPVVGFAPGGTVCTVAKNWGLAGDHPAYAHSLVASAIAGEARITARPTLRVTDDQGGDRVGFIFGAGLVARFFDAYYDAPEQGYVAAAGLVARVFGGTFTGGSLARRVLTPGPARLSIDGVLQAPSAWSLIAASVVRDLGLHMQLLYRAAERSDAFHIVASPLPPRRLSPQVGRVLLGRPLRGEGHVDALAREVVLELGEEGSTYVLDGDRIRASRVTVTAGPVLRYASVNPRPRRGPSLA